MLRKFWDSGGVIGFQIVPSALVAIAPESPTTT
jgi:hypothetical protein